MKNSLLVGMLVCLLTVSVNGAETIRPAHYRVAAGPDAEFELRDRLIRAVPGDVIELSEGKYACRGELHIASDHVTIRGAGHDKTVLSFAGQEAGTHGILATGNALTLEKFAVEDTLGNAIKVIGADGVVLREVRAEWTAGPQTSNGAYGLYPVDCRNVLIDGCLARGASDAGIYVGQSKLIVVRRSRAEANVAGIEIENSQHADVYENRVTGNTGGILVFDLPGLPMQGGRDVRVFRNHVVANNLKNFAPRGTTVATVPAGTGIMVMVTDRVEVFENEIRDHQTTNLSVVSYAVTERRHKDPRFDPYPEGISIHHNRFTGGGERPDWTIGEQLAPFLGGKLPDIVYDGIVSPKWRDQGEVPLEHGLAVHDNGEATFANLRLDRLGRQQLTQAHVDAVVERDVGPYARRMPPLAAVTLPSLPPPPAAAQGANVVYRTAPRWLSEWKLFQGSGAGQTPAPDVIPYDLNTALFSDYTSKYRWIRLPPGDSMKYRATSVLEFPVGTVIAKTFAYPRDARDPGQGEQWLETRIEHHEPHGWYGYSYRWNAEQTAAELALGGGRMDVSWIDAEGSQRNHQYLIPSALECLSCHSQAKQYVPLGPTIRNLNRDGIGRFQGRNQLGAWCQSGQLAGMPPSPQHDRLARFDDPTSGSLDARARAWLEVNCAHCHYPQGTAGTSGLDLRVTQREPARFGVWKSPVAAGPGSGGRSYDIVPGKPDASILLFRIATDNPAARMPNVSQQLVHDEAVALIRSWIAAMEDDTLAGGQ